jgi:hypothetical protein
MSIPRGLIKDVPAYRQAPAAPKDELSDEDWGTSVRFRSAFTRVLTLMMKDLTGPLDFNNRITSQKAHFSFPF